MAKIQDMPLTDSRLLGNCGRLKCCLLYEFSTYQELRARLPRVNSPCQASCGGSGCMTGKVKSIRVLAQSVVVGFPDGSQAEVPLDQLTWEGRSAHASPETWGAPKWPPTPPTLRAPAEPWRSAGVRVIYDLHLPIFPGLTAPRTGARRRSRAGLRSKKLWGLSSNDACSRGSTG